MRAAIVILVVAIIVAFSSPGHAAANTGRVAPRARLNPGEFTWHPETSPKGPRTRGCQPPAATCVRVSERRAHRA